MKQELPMVLLLAALPAAGNLAGGLLSEWLKPSPHFLNRALHAAAGIILAVIAVEVMPRALRAAPAWLLAPAFLAGGTLYLLIEAGIRRWQSGQKHGTGTGAWMIYVAIAADLLGDGFLIGTGSVVSRRLGLLLALGQVLADIPEGFAVIANFRKVNVGRTKRLLLSASLALPVIAAAVFAYFLMGERTPAVQMTALVVVAGLYVLAAVEDMLREAHESADDSRWSAISFMTGFALFLLLSGWLG
jgi:ZIP family zinc transporter